MSSRAVKNTLWALLGLVALVAVATAVDAQTANINSAGPLKNIWLSNDLACQVEHQMDTQYQFYSPGSVPAACGTWIAYSGTLYSPAAPASNAGASAAGSAYTPMGQTGPTGAGTAANPYRVVTTVNAGATMEIVQTDLYITGNEHYTSWINVTNNGATSVSPTVWKAGDCFLGGSDSGYGAVAVSAPGSIACTVNPNNNPWGRLEELVPINGGSKYYHDGYGDIWVRIGAQQAMPDTCQCTTLQDNGIGLSWTFTVGAGQTHSIGVETRFALNPDPTADFTWAQRPCQAIVDFSDISIPGIGGGLTQSVWDWGDGTSNTYSPWQGSVSHTFPGSGTYNVNLTVTNAAPRSDSIEFVVTVDACPPPIPEFTCTGDKSTPMEVAFFDNSQAVNSTISSWDWDFGDGSMGMGQQPVHRYMAQGTYTVTLNVTQANGISASTTRQCTPIPNDPPTLIVDERIIMYEEERLRIPVKTFDPDNDPLFTDWNPGPLAGTAARFDGKELFWRPHIGTAGEYPGIRFFTTDSYTTTEAYLHITVLPVEDPQAPGNADSDNDGVPDQHDTCPYEANPDQSTGCQGPPPEVPEEAPEEATEPDDGPEFSQAPADEVSDMDADGIADRLDNCVAVPNPDQSDLDRDGMGDWCDQDADGDGIVQIEDNCPFRSNEDQRDVNGDGVGDLCQGDLDSDGIPDVADNCARVQNADQLDSDGDGIGDACFLAAQTLEPSGPTHGGLEGDAPTTVKNAGSLAPWAWAGAGALVIAALVLAVVLVMRRKEQTTAAF